MRRRTIRVLALVLTLVMLVCQAGLTVRGTAGTGRLMSAGEDAGLSAAEGSTPEDQPGGYFRN